MKKAKQRVYEILWVMDKDDRTSQVVNLGIMALIVINVLGIIAASFDNFYTTYIQWFFIGGIISTLVFTVEYVCRIWTANLQYDDPSISHTEAIKKYVTSGSGIIDIVSILPSYLPMFIPIDLKFLRILRLGKLMRIFKLDKFSQALGLIRNIINRKKEVLLSTLYIMGMLVIISSVLMYYAENEAQPEAFPNIVATFWWAIVTLTTIGYGDVYPITSMGRFLASIIAILGIGIVALPTGILSSGFMEMMNEKEEEKKEKLSTAPPKEIKCEHCGHIQKIDK